jgi:large subunit ribosomal protein L21
MYAVISIKGKQYRVEEGRKVAVDKIDAKEGSAVKVDKVLAVEINGEHLFGEDAAKAQVKAKITEHFRDDKIVVLKYKSKNRYRKTTGHKQKLTMINIEEINVPGIEKPVKKVEKPKQTPKPKAESVKKEPEVKETEKAPKLTEGEAGAPAESVGKKSKESKPSAEKEAKKTSSSEAASKKTEE